MGGSENLAKLTLQGMASKIMISHHNGGIWYAGGVDKRLRPSTLDHMKYCLTPGSYKPKGVADALLAKVNRGMNLMLLNAEAQSCADCQARRKDTKARNALKEIANQFEQIEIVSSKRGSTISPNVQKRNLMKKLGLTDQEMKKRGIGRGNIKIDAGWEEPKVTAADADKTGDGGLGARIRAMKNKLRPKK